VFEKLHISFLEGMDFDSFLISPALDLLGGEIFGFE